MAPGVDFCILGPLEVLDGGRIVPLGGAKQRALLGLLLLHPNETLSTERLIDELWGERPPSSASNEVKNRPISTGMRVRRGYDSSVPKICNIFVF